VFFIDFIEYLIGEKCPEQQTKAEKESGAVAKKTRIKYNSFA